MFSVYNNYTYIIMIKVIVATYFTVKSIFEEIIALMMILPSLQDMTKSIFVKDFERKVMKAFLEKRIKIRW